MHQRRDPDGQADARNRSARPSPDASPFADLHGAGPMKIVAVEKDPPVGVALQDALEGPGCGELMKKAAGAQSDV